MIESVHRQINTVNNNNTKSKMEKEVLVEGRSESLTDSESHIQNNNNISRSSNNNIAATTTTNLIEKYRPKTYKPYSYLNPFIYDYTLNPFENPLEKYKVSFNFTFGTLLNPF